MFFLQLGTPSCLFRGEVNFLIYCCEYVSDSFKVECRCNHINFVLFRVVKLLTTMLITNLWWVINCFYVHAHSFWVIWIFRVVSVQVTNPLFIVACSLPEAYKFGKFFVVHEGNIVNMSVDLSRQH